MIRRLLPLLAFAILSTLALADEKSDWDTLRKNDAPLPSRMQAARLIAERVKNDSASGKVVTDFVDLGTKANTPPELKTALSDAISLCNNPDAGKALAKHVGQGQPAERGWILRSARGIATSPDLDKAIMAKGLTDEDLKNRQDAVQLLVDHKYTAAIPAFEGVLKAGKDTELMGPIVGGISEMLTGGPQWADWETRLVTYARDKNDATRRAALAALSKTKNVSYLDLFIESLASTDWSTRALCVAFLEKTTSKKGLGAIIDQMKKEPPGTRMNAECYGALERLSGMKFGDKAEDWATWWKNSEATFEFPKNSGAAKTEGKRPKGYESGTSVAQFYGIEIESKRVCFVIDISGSMNEAVADTSAGGGSRFDVAKRELNKIIDELPPGSLFNIVTFSTDVETWLERIGDLPKGVGTKGGAKKGPSTGGKKDDKKDEKEKDDKQKAKEAEEAKKLDEALRAKAHEYVNRLAANGGTNIYDALEAAFEDPEVDTIFFLTDGQPNFGREIDPTMIREAVQRWNETRKIKINTISIGTDFDLLKWIAADNGGDHKFFE